MLPDGDRTCSLCRNECPKNYLGAYLENASAWHVPVIVNGRWALMAKLQLDERESTMQVWLADALGLERTGEHTLSGRPGYDEARWEVTNLGLSVPSTPKMVEQIRVVVTEGDLDDDLILGTEAVESGFCVLLLPRSVCCLVHRSSIEQMQQGVEHRRDGQLDAGCVPAVVPVQNRRGVGPVIDLLQAPGQMRITPVALSSPGRILDLREKGVKISIEGDDAPAVSRTTVRIRAGSPGGVPTEWHLEGRVVYVARSADGAAAKELGIEVDAPAGSGDHAGYVRWLKAAYLGRMCW